MHTQLLRSGIVLVFAAALTAAITTGVGAPWRTILALLFVLICPGASLAGVLGLRDRLTELVVVAPLSLTLVTLTSVALFYAGVWSARLEFALLLALCLAGLVWSHFGPRYEVKGDG